MKVKIAYLILCHKDPEFVQRTAEKMNHTFIPLFTILPSGPERNTGYLYFRKAISESRELLDFIDQFHAQQILPIRNGELS